MTTVKTVVRPLNQIAQEIVKDWNKVYFGAQPYLAAMLTLNGIDEHYYQDTAQSIVLYFLANAGTWRGDTARRVKKELNAMCK
ncbi:MAG: hypothetical protein ACTSYR_04085 [Candidatus Odinarchaeia archaeon]